MKFLIDRLKQKPTLSEYVIAGAFCVALVASPFAAYGIISKDILKYLIAILLFVLFYVMNFRND